MARTMTFYSKGNHDGMYSVPAKYRTMFEPVNAINGNNAGLEEHHQGHAIHLIRRNNMKKCSMQKKMESLVPVNEAEYTFENAVIDYIDTVNNIVRLKKIEDTDKTLEYHGSVDDYVLGVVYSRNRQTLTVFMDAITNDSTPNLFNVNDSYLNTDSAEFEKELDISITLIENWKKAIRSIQTLNMYTNKEW